jgi:hypothetical protein
MAGPERPDAAKGDQGIAGRHIFAASAISATSSKRTSGPLKRT